MSSQDEDQEHHSMSDRFKMRGLRKALKETPLYNVKVRGLHLKNKEKPSKAPLTISH